MNERRIQFWSGKTFLIRAGYALHLANGQQRRVIDINEPALDELMVMAVTRDGAK
jgi:hypothetical protein